MAISHVPPMERLRKLLRRHLVSNSAIKFSRDHLTELLDVVFHTSLRHEESRFISCMISVVDRENPAGIEPTRVLPQRASFVPFNDPILLNARNLVKLAHAMPPWASSLAVSHSGSVWQMVGLFDQEVHYRNSLNQEDADRFERAGFFQIEITDIGAFSIYDSSVLIGRYSQGVVVRHFYDVLKRGPIADIIRKYSMLTQARAEGIILKDDGVSSKPYEGAAEAIWIRTLSRLLLHIRRANHGGAVLLLPTFQQSGLKIKYGLHYSKLEEVIAAHVAAEWIEADSEDMIFEQTKDLEIEDMPTFLHVRQSVGLNDKQNSIKAEIGCVSTIASLARVDGLVLLEKGFTVRGFGVEITTKEEPPAVFSAGDSQGSIKKRKPLNLSDFGTRHRSMMRYCYSHPGSLGFVVSQDGDVRAITRIDDDLVLWENIRLQDVRMTPSLAVINRAKVALPQSKKVK